MGLSSTDENSFDFDWVGRVPFLRANSAKKPKRILVGPVKK